MNFKIFILATVVTLIHCRPGLSHPENLVMDCGNTIADEIAAMFRENPFGARRISKHHLVVGWERGRQNFIDEPPYDQILDGVSYLYCGYNPTMQMSLIHKREDDIFTGVLLDHITGTVMPAGQYVSFSKDKKKYFATVQPDGLDGEEWYVYTKDGKLEWKGLSGISQKHPKFNYYFFVVELSSPRWNADGLLEAIGKCTAGKDRQENETTVRLKRIGPRWEWLPKISCP